MLVRNLPLGGFVNVFVALERLGIHLEPAAVAGAFFVVRWSKDIDELGETLRFEAVDITFFRGECGDVPLGENSVACLLEENIFAILTLP